MTREDVIRMAHKVGFTPQRDEWLFTEMLERFFALASEAGAAAERNKLADWMKRYGFATGHGDTMEHLCDALGTEIVDRIKWEIEAERGACAQVCDDANAEIADAEVLAERIRERGDE
jgi:hypothetical protein